MFMPTITIYLPDKIYLRLKELEKTSHDNVSQMVRKAVERYLEETK